jgi:hypothetical protein
MAVVVFLFLVSWDNALVAVRLFQKEKEFGG